MKSLWSNLLFAIVMVLAVPIGLFSSGCASQSQLAPGGAYTDSVLYDADTVIATSYDGFHAFVLWERQNHTTYATSNPKISAAADNIRTNAKQWINSAITLRDAYAANPTAANKTALQTSIAVITAALVEANQYLVNNKPLAQ